jgi:hypothetical protein
MCVVCVCVIDGRTINLIAELAVLIVTKQRYSNVRQDLLADHVQSRLQRVDRLDLGIECVQFDAARAVDTRQTKSQLNWTRT